MQAGVAMLQGVGACEARPRGTACGEATRSCIGATAPPKPHVDRWTPTSRVRRKDGLAPT